MTQEQLDQAMNNAEEGCQTMLNAGITRTGVIFAGGLTNLLVTLINQGLGEITVNDVKTALTEYARVRGN